MSQREELLECMTKLRAIGVDVAALADKCKEGRLGPALTNIGARIFSEAIRLQAVTSNANGQQAESDVDEAKEIAERKGVDAAAS